MTSERFFARIVHFCSTYVFSEFSTLQPIALGNSRYTDCNERADAQPFAYSRRACCRQGFAHPRSNIEALGIESGMLITRSFGAGSGAYALHIGEILKKAGRVYVIDVQKDLLRRIHTEACKRGIDGAMEFISGGEFGSSWRLEKDR